MSLKSDLFHSIPADITGSKDLASLLMETEAMRDNIKSMTSRGEAVNATIPPRIAGFFEVNKIAKVDQSAIDQSIDWLSKLLKHAPKIHLALNSVPDIKERGRLVGWFRSEISPTALIEFSLSPSLGGGCIVRTPVRIYDFSAKSVLQKKLPEFRKILTESEVAA